MENTENKTIEIDEALSVHEIIRNLLEIDSDIAKTEVIIAFIDFINKHNLKDLFELNCEIAEERSKNASR